MDREKDNQSESATTDDAYWQALFQQERSVVPDVSVEEEIWSPSDLREDSQLNWAADKKDKVDNPWLLASELQDSDRTLQLEVTGHNKGGLLVMWNGLQGFVPASQLVNFPQFHLTRERLGALAAREGQVLELKIIEVSQSTNRLILSERAAFVKATERTDLLQQLRVNDTTYGKVTNLTNFGVFVDLGGVEGLIHISELSWSRVIHPSNIVRPGDTVKVLVLNIDHDNERIALSLKQLKLDPWATAEDRYQPGDMVSGTVSNVVNYGAFVILEEELEGLIHISELAEGSFLHPRNVVQKGDYVSARVLHVNSRKKRLALTLRGVQKSIESSDDFDI